ncbi:unnamed protein product [Ilex paraguariensis]|uniref:NAD-dependent epimerase/dehydratase domain-containing protein n=1 Tax=Ilex paraguariensis TaxID=185542 RepID=A0ABC8S8K0_9AQUA
MAKEGEAVCVTGGSGYIGSWLVRFLLERGYTVHATVKDLSTRTLTNLRFHQLLGVSLLGFLLVCNLNFSKFCSDLDDEKETKHLEALEGANSLLRLFQIDLLDYDSIVAAVNGTAGVFHLASPCIVDEVRDPENELLAPAIKGTNNVLTAAKELGVRRVVVTSSISAITPSRYWPADVVKNEDCWTDVEYCKHNNVGTSPFLHFDSMILFVVLLVVMRHMFIIVNLID